MLGRSINKTARAMLIAWLLAGVQAHAQLSVERRNGEEPPLPTGPAAPEWMAAHFINVGQGSATLFEFSCGLMLVDTGGQGSAAVDWKKRFTDYLDRVFTRRPDLRRTIDVVYLSHPHPDHTLGVNSLITGNRYSIGNVVVADANSGFSINQQRALIRYANQKRIPQVPIRTSMLHPRLGLTSATIDPLRCNGRQPNIRVLWGQHDEPHSWPNREEEDENNHSVAVRIEFGQSSFLAVGDMEEIAQKAMIERYKQNPRVLDVDVYLAGHHGSHNGTYEGLVEAMTPELAVASAGNPAHEEEGFAAYRFGHPNKKAIDRLSDPEHGVAFRRPAVTVPIGISGFNPTTGAAPVYERHSIDRAIFATGWDGDVVVLANMDGTKRVIID